MLPSVAIGQRAWAETVAELDRVFPAEGLLVPLVALVPRDPDRVPGATLRLEELEEVVVARVVRLPPDRQRNLGARVEALADADARVGEQVEALVRRFPLLRASAYLHSHPFARGSTRPSSGSGDYGGHMVPLLRRNRDCGLAASFSLIACRGDDGEGWKLQAFALDDRARIIDLGFARCVPQADRRVLRAHQRGLDARAPIIELVRDWLGELGRDGRELRCDELFGGWIRIVVPADAARALVAMVPLEFPGAPVRLFVWDRQSGGVAEFNPRCRAVLAPDYLGRVLGELPA